MVVRKGLENENREMYERAYNYRSLPAKIRLAEARRILNATPDQKVPSWDDVLDNS